MSEFFDKAMSGNNEPTKPELKVTAITQLAGDTPDLAEALMTLLRHVMNPPEGVQAEGVVGVRNVGEKVTIVLPDLEGVVLNSLTGEKQPMNFGTFSVTVMKEA